MDPSLQCGVIFPLKPLQKCGLKLTNTTATGSRVEAVSLLESVEATEVGDARVFNLDLVGDAEDGRDLDERGRHDLAVEDGLAEVGDGLRAQEAPAGGGGGRGRRGRGRGHVRRPPPRSRHSRHLTRSAALGASTKWSRIKSSRVSHSPPQHGNARLDGDETLDEREHAAAAAAAGRGGEGRGGGEQQQQSSSVEAGGGGGEGMG